MCFIVEFIVTVQLSRINSIQKVKYNQSEKNHPSNKFLEIWPEQKQSLHTSSIHINFSIEFMHSHSKASFNNSALMNSFLNDNALNEGYYGDSYENNEGAFLSESQISPSKRNSLVNNQRKKKIEQFLRNKQTINQQLNRYLGPEDIKMSQRLSTESQHSSLMKEQRSTLFNSTDNTFKTTHSLYILRESPSFCKSSNRAGKNQNSSISLQKQYKMLQQKRKSLEKEYEERKKQLSVQQRYAETTSKEAKRLRRRVQNLQNVRENYRSQSEKNQYFIRRSLDALKRSKISLRNSVLQGSKGLQRSRSLLQQKKRKSAFEIRSDLRIETQKQRQREQLLFQARKQSHHRIKQSQSESKRAIYDNYQQKCVNIANEKLQSIESEIKRIKQAEIRLKKIHEEGFVRNGEYFQNVDEYKNKIREAKLKNQRKIQFYKNNLSMCHSQVSSARGKLELKFETPIKVNGQFDSSFERLSSDKGNQEGQKRKEKSGMILL